MRKHYYFAAWVVAELAAIAAVLLLVLAGHPPVPWALADGFLLGLSPTMGIKHTND